MKTKRRMKKMNRHEIEKKYNEGAGHIRRLIGYGIDWYLTSLLVMAPVALLYGIETGKKAITIDISLLSLPYALAAFVIGFLLCMLYLVYYPLKNGQTIGKKVTSIKIIKMDGKDVDLKTLLLREVIGVILVEGVMYTISTYSHQIIAMSMHMNYSNYLAYGFMAILIVSIVLAFTKPEKRMIHDYIAGTKVIRLK